MAKYSFEFKKKIVQEYLSGKGSSSFLAKKYGISSYFSTYRSIFLYLLPFIVSLEFKFASY